MTKSTNLFLFTCLALSAAVTASGTDKTKTFAVVPKSIAVAFYADVEKGCKEEAKKLGVNVIYTGPETADAAKQVQILQDLVSRGVDGFAVAPMDADSKPRLAPDILITHLMEGIGIALDLKGKRMFLTDLAGSLYSARLDGSEKKPLLVAQGNLTGVAYAEITTKED